MKKNSQESQQRVEQEMDDKAEEIGIVIVGAGICGLATALALHRKGIESVVLERSDKLRSYGAAMGVLTNGWRALDHLGLGSRLRQTALPLQGVRDIWPESNKQRAGALSKGVARCVKRTDLINILAEDLPRGAIRFACHIISVELDTLTNYHNLRIHDGCSIKAKILIGCDGASSVVAEYLGLKPRKVFPACAVRGLTYYPTSHEFSPEFVRTHGNNIVCGRSPITQNLVFWFLLLPGYSPQDSEIFKNPEMIKQMAQQKIRDTDFPKETTDMIKDCDVTSLSLTRLTYKTTWDVFFETFRRGSATVAGNAMHAMGPFLGQGGSAALEDAIAFARKLSEAFDRNKIDKHDFVGNYTSDGIGKIVENAMDLYVKERRMRVLSLSAQTYLTGLLLSSTSAIRKLLIYCSLWRSNPSHWL